MVPFLLLMIVLTLLCGATVVRLLIGKVLMAIGAILAIIVVTIWLGETAFWSIFYIGGAVLLIGSLYVRAKDAPKHRPPARSDRAHASVQYKRQEIKFSDHVPSKAEKKRMKAEYRRRQSEEDQAG